MTTPTNKKAKSNWNKSRNNRKLIGKDSKRLWKDFTMTIDKGKGRESLNQSKEHKNHNKEWFIKLNLEETALQIIRLSIWQAKIEEKRIQYLNNNIWSYRINK